MPSTILVVEDDPTFAALIRRALKADGHVPVQADTCEEGWRYFESLRPALAVLDVGLPDESGLALCRRIRAHPALAKTPIVVLTAKGQYKDKSLGFEAGADHYLVKPMQIEELRLWVGALLRRAHLAEQEAGVLRAPDFMIDPQTHTVTAGGAILRDLSHREFDLLYELVLCRSSVLSKEELLDSVWQTSFRENVVEVYIQRVRAKLGPAGGRISTLIGVGYRFD